MSQTRLLRQQSRKTLRITQALVQFFWSGLLGAVLETAEVPFRLERRTALWSGVHFLLTAAVFSLAGWQCRWFPYRETWLCLLGLLLLCYLLMWAVRYVGWRQDVRAIRKGVGLPEEPEQPGCRKAAGRCADDDVVVIIEGDDADGVVAFIDLGRGLFCKHVLPELHGLGIMEVDSLKAMGRCPALRICSCEAVIEMKL